MKLEAQLFCLLRMLQEVSAWLQDGQGSQGKGMKRDGSVMDWAAKDPWKRQKKTNSTPRIFSLRGV